MQDKCRAHGDGAFAQSARSREPRPAAAAAAAATSHVYLLVPSSSPRCQTVCVVPVSLHHPSRHVRPAEDNSRVY